MRLAAFAILLLGLVTASCSLPKIDPADQLAARAVFDQVRKGDFRGVEERLDASLQTAEADPALRQAGALIPAGMPISVRQDGSNIVESPGSRDSQITDEYTYPDKVLVVATSFHSAAGSPARLTGFRITPYSRAALRALEFSLVGKSPGQCC